MTRLRQKYKRLKRQLDSMKPSSVPYLSTNREIVKIADNVYLSDTMLQHDKEKTMDMADKEAIERMAEFIYENHLYQREVIQEPDYLRLAYRLDVVKMGDDV